MYSAYAAREDRRVMGEMDKLIGISRRLSMPNSDNM